MAMRESERLKAIGALAGGVAHNFDIVMDVIAAGATAIEDSVVPDSRIYRDSERIRGAARHAGDLTRRLMSVARMCETGSNVRHEPGPADGVVRTRSNLFSRHSRSAISRSSFLDKGQKPWVQANASQLWTYS